MDQRWIDGHIAMGMVITHRLADDLCALGMLAIGEHAESLHRVKDAALGRLQSVASIG